jgi:hypothetical protein
MSTLSVSTCRTSWPREAPNAWRIANSRVRADARAISKLATLTHTIRSTKLTAASRITSVGRTLPVKLAWAGSSRSDQPNCLG